MIICLGREFGSGGHEIGRTRQQLGGGKGTDSAAAKSNCGAICS